MPIDSFPVGVEEHLKWYVYRLIDPRNGETFYVGKGKGDRIFQHVKNSLSTTGEEDAADLKLQRIKDITNGFHLEVIPVIHRHGISNEEVAYQIEAALIDAYPGLTNQVNGHGSDDYGVRHVVEIINEYAAQDFEAKEPLILINISRTYDDETKNTYEAARFCWRINPDRARKYKLVLAHRRGVVVGAFRPQGAWLPATAENFPGCPNDVQRRFGFVGERAEDTIASLYLQRRVPDKYRAKGAANPIRFVEVDKQPVQCAQRW